MTVSVGTSEAIALGASDRLLRSQARRLYENAPIGIAATVVNASILVGILRNVVEPGDLLSWWSCLMALTLVRYLQVERFRRVEAQRDFDPNRWIGCFVVGIFVSGVLWGAAGIWLLPGSVPHQTFIAFVLGGMVAGAAATFSIRMDAFLAYSVPTLTPLALQFFLLGDELHLAMGAMMALFGLLLTGTAYRVGRLLNRTFALKGEVGDLRSVLSSATEESRELVARLERSERARVELEAELARKEEQTQARLQQYVSDMADTFVTLQEKNEQRLESEFLRRLARGCESTAENFAEGVAYRVQGSLSNISDQIRQARARSEIFGSGVARDHLRRVEAAVEAAESLMDDLTLFANGGAEVSDRVEVNEFLGTVSEAWKSTLPDDVDLRLETCARACPVRAHLPALALAIHQILANASEAISAERGTIQIRTCQLPWDAVACSSEPAAFARATRFVQLEILDDGDGMPKEMLARVFEPFFSTKARGRGLGMAIARSIVLRHRGFIAITSRSLHGTRVRVFLPLEEARHEVN